MSLVIEAILISIGMILLFFAAFLGLFLLALSLAPIERGISNYIWAHTTPPPRKIPVQNGSFKDFSKKF